MMIITIVIIIAVMITMIKIILIIVVIVIINSAFSAGDFSPGSTTEGKESSQLFSSFFRDNM